MVGAAGHLDAEDRQRDEQVKRELTGQPWPDRNDDARDSVAEDTRQEARSATHPAKGLALRGRRRLKAAVTCFEHAVAAQPDSVDAWFWLAVTRDNRGQEAQAVPAYRWALGLGIDDPNRQAYAGPAQSYSVLTGGA